MLISNEPSRRRPEQPTNNRERQACLATFYALYLRQVLHLAPDEAEYRVRERYPHVGIRKQGAGTV